MGRKRSSSSLLFSIPWFFSSLRLESSNKDESQEASLQRSAFFPGTLKFSPNFWWLTQQTSRKTWSTSLQLSGCSPKQGHSPLPPPTSGAKEPVVREGAVGHPPAPGILHLSGAPTGLSQRQLSSLQQPSGIGRGRTDVTLPSGGRPPGLCSVAGWLTAMTALSSPSNWLKAQPSLL